MFRLDKVKRNISVADPDLQIRKGGWQSLKKEFFPPFGPQFGLKIGGAWAPRPLPWIHHCICKGYTVYVQSYLPYSPKIPIALSTKKAYFAINCTTVHY